MLQIHEGTDVIFPSLISDLSYLSDLSTLSCATYSNRLNVPEGKDM